MTTLITDLVVLVFAALLYVFYRMQKRHTKFSTRFFFKIYFVKLSSVFHHINPHIYSLTHRQNKYFKIIICIKGRGFM